MPPSHRKYLEWTPSRIVGWGKKIGPATAELLQKIIESRTHPEQAYRSCLGILRLENGARRALKFGALSFKSLRKILSSGLDRLEQSKESSDSLVPTHENIRGGHYYH